VKSIPKLLNQRGKLSSPQSQDVFHPLAKMAFCPLEMAPALPPANGRRQALGVDGVCPQGPHDLPPIRAEAELKNGPCAAALLAHKPLSPQGGEMVFTEAKLG
jgi:hypothetical protein